MRKSKLLIAQLLVLLSTLSAFSAEAGSFKIEWLAPYTTKFSEESSFTSLNFKGAVLNDDYQPEFTISQPLTGFPTDVKVQLKNVVAEQLKDKSFLQNPGTIGKDFRITTNVSSKKRKPFAAVSVLPIRQTSPGNFERLISFDAEITPVYGARLSSARTYASSSVLASGDFYRIAVTQNGVYKIDYSLLKSMGVDVDNIDPRALQLFGNGGGMLPYLNSKFRYDDVQENAIYVEGESDGHFDNGDFILFYGSNQTKWNYDPASGKFQHQVNYYSDTTYYFLTANKTSSGKRILQRASAGPATVSPVNSFPDYYYHEYDAVNFLKSGREWYGEGMDNLNSSLTFNHSFPNLVTSDTISFRGSIAGRATGAGINSFTLKLNNQTLQTKPFSNVLTNVQANYALDTPLEGAMIAGSSSIALNLLLSSTDPNSQAWLNFYEFNFKRDLNASGNGNQFLFREPRVTGSGNIAEYDITNTNSNFSVWDITDQTNVTNQVLTNTGSSSSFSASSDILHEYIAFNRSGFNIPFLTGAISNQNLHATTPVNMLIITNPLFLSQANELADFHRTHDGISVAVATTRQIFNEFSSGAEDVSALRDYIKMFYDRNATQGGDSLKYVLLFGDASYDNKHRLSGNTNFVTSFQSAASLNLTSSYITDDFFALLDDNEGECSSFEVVDVAVGRLPVKNAAEAQTAVNKIKHYVVGNGPGNPNPTLGNWRNVLSFVADDQDQNIHLIQTDTIAKSITRNFPIFNIDKIYLDAYNQESTPGGQRYPDAHKAIVDRVQKGTLLINYIGHGGELGWAHERVLEVSDILSWTNYDRLAAFMTATCEFTRVDDPARTSAGEDVFLNPQGGAICMYTTSRLAFSISNYNLCLKFYTHIFDNSGARYPTSGEIFERTKAEIADQFIRNFLFIGDPAVRLSYPELKVKTNTVNGINVSQPIDTLKALTKVVIAGEVDDNAGNKMTGFSGTIYPTVYDKPVSYSTLGNDKNDPIDPSNPMAFTLQKNVIYSGKVSVTNGDFRFEFVVPKDIAFQYGKGRLSYYAQNGITDAAGWDTVVTVGGVGTNLVQDIEGPKIQLYLNDEKFVRGGYTDPNPILYAIIKDSSGVNTVGTGIGHDMTAELDAKTEKKYLLNDYYENDLDSYQSGKVKYPFKSLAAGPHTLTFKVWDVYNNSNEVTTDFIVAESAQLALEHVLNYPNPFTTHTTFMFEHNRPSVPLDVQVQVFTVSGKLIKTITDRITTEGYRSDQMEWNGLDDFGDKIGKGVYVYHLRVKTAGGEYADKFEKLVILR